MRARKRVTKKIIRQPFDKYDLYQKSVQSPETDVLFLRRVYRDLRKKSPRTLREDFCGTFALSSAWVKLSRNHRAVGIDMDPEPLEYGRRRFAARRMSDSEIRRLQLFEKDVLAGRLPAADIAVAMNFSYFIFLERPQMKKYFANVLDSLNKNGLFVLDIFGGSLCYSPNEEQTNLKTHIYYWDQQGFDPVSNRAMFYIHFKPRGQKKIERVFRYNWRMWSIPEIRDLLNEVGFKRTHVYWEGTDRKGDGNGVFTRTEKGEACESWIAYIVAEK